MTSSKNVFCYHNLVMGKMEMLPEDESEAEELFQNIDIDAVTLTNIIGWNNTIRCIYQLYK